MKGILFLLLPVLCTCSSLILVQPSRTSRTRHNRRAEVACWKSGNDYTLTFYLDVSSNYMGRIYTINNVDPTIVSIGTFDDQAGIEGSGTTLDPYTFSVTGSGMPISLDAINRDMKKGYVTNPDVISVNVMAKAMYGFPFYHHVIFKDDVLYKASCNFTEVQDKLLSSGQIIVDGELTESPYLIDDLAELKVLLNGVPTTSVQIGDEISLIVSAKTPTVSKGVYVYSCSICDRMDCSGLVVEFIDTNGCSIGSYISNFVGVGEMSQTTTFQAFVLNNQEYVHIRCRCNFCYESNDPRCINYCDYNNQEGRKRRQAERAPVTTAEDTLVTAQIRITTDGAGLSLDNGQFAPVTGQQVAPQTSMGLLAAVITLASLVFVVLVVAMIVFCRMSS